MRRYRIQSDVLTGFAAALAVAGSAAGELSPHQMTSRQILRAATTLLESQPLTLDALNVGVMLVNRAAELDPGDAETCRVLLQAAELAERPELKSKALGALIRLDPKDEVARLLYLNDAIERFQTIEQRAAAYEKLLAPRNRAALGPAVASRLATDYALLLQRAGDLDGFADWLSEAVALDPSNRTAATTAAGFFRMSVGDDPFAEAELLVTAALADPTSFNTQALLAQLMLENGAYVAADRIYKLAAGTLAASNVAAAGGMLADRAVAQWGRGDADAALDTVRDRQSEADAIYRRQLALQDPSLGTLELARRQAPISSTLATVRAAILQRRGDDMARPALDAAIAAYRAEIDYAATQQNADPLDDVQRYLQMAFIELWLGGDVERASRHLAEAAAAVEPDELSKEARTRFEGWMALRSGDAVRAEELLRATAENDPAARLGLSLALHDQGRRSEAGAELLHLARSETGTLIGVWSADLLSEMVGRRLPPDETAARLEDLASSMPHVLDRLPDEPTLAFSMRLVPTKKTFTTYEPVIVNLEIANNAPFPLAIDPRGPIRPQVALVVDMGVARQPGLDELRPLIIDIDRRLRLKSSERVVIPVDLRRGALAQVVNRSPLRGATLKVTAIANFQYRGGNVIRPGLLGSEVTSPPIRVDGVRLTGPWVADSIAEILEPDSSRDLERIGQLSYLVEMIRKARESVPLRALEEFGNPRQMAADSAAAIAEAFRKLDPVARTWVLGAIPRGADIEEIYEIAQQDDDKLVRLAYLLYALKGPEDPMLAAGLNAEDPDVQLVARMMNDRITTMSGEAQ